MEQQKQQNMNIKVEESTLFYNNNNHNDPNNTSSNNHNNHNNHNNTSIDDNTNNMDQQQASSNKRLATKGQWQTPPVGPFFPSVSQQQAQQQQQQQPSISGTIGNLTTAVNVPNSSDDYARALQEAYRRGAAAALSRNNNINSSNNNTGNNNTTTTTIDIANPLQASSINTTKLSSTSSSSNTIVGTVQPINTAATPMTTTNMGVPTPLPFTPDSSNTTMQPPQQSPPSMLGINNQQQQQQQLFFVSNNNIITQPTTTTTATITSTMTTQQQQQQQTQQPSSTTSIQMTEPNNNKLASSQHRSVSLPDMTTYANKTMNDEETKRLKRLARNRASARLRRLKKKNLVESYEAEVGVLEASLSKLRAHKWGIGTDSDALLEALSMDRGQQKIDSDKRKELITSILSQQKEQVQTIMDCQLENMILGWIARHGEEDDNNNVETDKVIKKEEGENYEDELNALAEELNSVLQLTPEQKKQLQKATEGVEEERKAIEVVDTSLSALLSNPWLMNNGIEECMNQFTSLMNPTQLSKFMLWVDQNAESIDQLDYVNAPPADDQPTTGPMFVFGIDDVPTGDDS